MSALEAELKAKDGAYGGLQAKLEELQVMLPCLHALSGAYSVVDHVVLEKWIWMSKVLNVSQ